VPTPETKSGQAEIIPKEPGRVMLPREGLLKSSYGYLRARRHVGNGQNSFIERAVSKK